MTDPDERSTKRCAPGCTCGRHTQYRWAGVTLESRFWAKVDRGNADECWRWTGARNSCGYGELWADGRTQKAHRIAYMMMVGSIPPGMHVDHRCFTRECVNPAHLRVATHKQNVENHQGPKRNSTSGVRGVYRKPNGRWCAEVRHNGKRVHVGCFGDIESAEAAVIAKRRELHTHNDMDRSA